MESNITVIIITGSILGIGALIGLGVYLYNLQVSKPVNEIVVQVASDLTDPCTVAEKATGSLFSWLTEITIQALNCGAIFEPHYGIALGVLGMSVLWGLPNIKPSSVSKPSLDGKAFLLTKCGLLSQLMLAGDTIMLAGDTTDAPVGDAIGEGSSSLERVPSPSVASLIDEITSNELSSCAFPESSEIPTGGHSSENWLTEAPYFAQQRWDLDSGLNLAMAYHTLDGFKEMMAMFDAMVHDEKLTSDLVNLSLWNTAKVLIMQYETQIKVEREAIIDFERQYRFSQGLQYSEAKKALVFGQNQKLSIDLQPHRNALANIITELNRYEAIKSGSPTYTVVSWDQTAALNRYYEVTAQRFAYEVTNPDRSSEY